MVQRKTFRRVRFGLGLCGILLLAAAGTLVGYRQMHLTDLQAVRIAFERDVGPLDLASPPLPMDGDGNTGLDAVSEARLQLFHQAREIHGQGREALDDGRLDTALGAIAQLADLRRRLLTESPRLVDLMLAHGTSRFALDLAGDVVVLPEVDTVELQRLVAHFDADADHQGVAAAMVYESRVLLTHLAHRPDTLPIRERFYHWFNGAADQATGLRFYHAMAEAMRQPVLDVRTFLYRRTHSASPAFAVASDFLIVNLQEVPLDHRFETTSRRLIRLAVAARLDDAAAANADRTNIGTAPEMVTDAVTGGPVGRVDEPDGRTRLVFAEAQARQAERPSRPATAPPAFPLELVLPAAL